MTTLVEVEPVKQIDTTKIVDETSNALTKAQRFIIDSNDAYEAAGDFLRGLKTIQKEIDETFDGPIKAAFASHKSIVAAKKKHAEPLTEAESVLKSKMIVWSREQEKIRLAEQARADELARKHAEELRAAEVAALKAAGEKEQAIALQEKPVVAAPIVVPKATPKVDGIAVKKTWDFRVVDESKLPRKYLSVNAQAIRAEVKAMRGETSIPGVEVFEVESISAAGF